MSEFEKKINQMQENEIYLKTENERLRLEAKSKLQAHTQLQIELTNMIEALEQANAEVLAEYQKALDLLEQMRKDSFEMNSKLEYMTDSEKLISDSIEKTNSNIDSLE
jgi:uncharacterized membrane-anchored protein YhcB (DUF1043 family)